MPAPKVASLTELNENVAAADLTDDTRVIGGRPVTVAAAFADEQPLLVQVEFGVDLARGVNGLLLCFGGLESPDTK
ncbi:hypothetical protein MLGJGCBP_01200 [Rhodococcus sp. T7]|nr:hypothetical protein MLGJGCBP_01200 [Rhodococcus sp. T7]